MSADATTHQIGAQKQPEEAAPPVQQAAEATQQAPESSSTKGGPSETPAPQDAAASVLKRPRERWKELMQEVAALQTAAKAILAAPTLKSSDPKKAAAATAAKASALGRLNGLKRRLEILTKLDNALIELEALWASEQRPEALPTLNAIYIKADVGCNTLNAKRGWAEELSLLTERRNALGVPEDAQADPLDMRTTEEKRKNKRLPQKELYKRTSARVKVLSERNTLLELQALKRDDSQDAKDARIRQLTDEVAQLQLDRADLARQLADAKRESVVIVERHIPYIPNPKDRNDEAKESNAK